MVFTSLKLSKDAHLFSGSPLKFRAIKRPLPEEDESMEVDDSWMSMDAQFDESASDQSIFTEKKWFLKTIVSNRALPILFHKTLSYEVKTCVYAEKFDSYGVQMEGRHASELCALIKGLDELSQIRPFNIVYDMVCRKFFDQNYTNTSRDAIFLLRIIYLVAFYKAGWTPKMELKSFFDENRGLIHDIAKELMPNPNNAMEPYADILDQEDQCRVIYVMLWSGEQFCKWDRLAEKILSEKKKLRHWPTELKQMLAEKLIEQTSTQQGFYKRSASEYNAHSLPTHSSSLLPLRLVNKSFKSVAEKVTRKSCRFYRPVVAVGDCLQDGKLVYLSASVPQRVQPAYAFCSQNMFLNVEHLLDPLSTKVYLNLHNSFAGEEYPGLRITNTDKNFQIGEEGVRQHVYTMSVKELLTN